MTEDELYNKFLSGDTSAYDELIMRLSNNITVYINGYLHDLQEAENLMIETFAKIMFKKPSIKKAASRHTFIKQHEILLLVSFVNFCMIICLVLKVWMKSLQMKNN